MKTLRQAELACRWTQAAPFDATFAVGNASFEEGAGWNSAVGAVVPLAWNVDVTLKNGHMRPENKNASDGYYCYSISTDAGSAIDFYQDVDLAAGQYKLTADLKPNAVSAAKLYTATGDQKKETPATGSPDSWKRTAVQFIVPQDHAKVRIGLTSSATILIDNFKLTKMK